MNNEQLSKLSRKDLLKILKTLKKSDNFNFHNINIIDNKLNTIYTLKNSINKHFKIVDGKVFKINYILQSDVLYWLRNNYGQVKSPYEISNVF